MWINQDWKGLRILMVVCSCLMALGEATAMADRKKAGENFTQSLR